MTNDDRDREPTSINVGLVAGALSVVVVGLMMLFGLRDDGGASAAIDPARTRPLVRPLPAAPEPAVPAELPELAPDPEPEPEPAPAPAEEPVATASLADDETWDGPAPAGPAPTSRLAGRGGPAEDELLPTASAKPDAPISLLDGRYTVKPGDTLWQVAVRAYGKGSAYRQILDANEATIDDPDHLIPGTVLLLP